MLRCFILLLLSGFLSGQKSITVPLGSEFTLHCLPDEPPTPYSAEYIWKFGTSPLDHTESALIFKPVKKSDFGTYECIVKGYIGEDVMKMRRQFHLFVDENIPIETWFFISATEGEAATLPCRPSFRKNTRSPTVTWFKENQAQVLKKITPLPNNQIPAKGKQKVQEETAGHGLFWASEPAQQDWSVTFSRLELEDGGLYKCKVIMGQTTETVLTELEVKEAPPPRCFNQLHAWEACPDPDSRSWKAIVSESMTEFSIKLYKLLNEREPSSNLLFSPISIASLLSHLLLGSRGEMRANLEKVLSLPSNFSCIHSVMKKMKMETKDSIVMASQMFYSPEYSLSQSFINQSQEFYGSVPEKLTNNSELNMQMINKWVESKTQSRISQLVKQIDEDNKFMLLNAVYFIGKWKGSFKVDSGTFTTFSGEVLNVPTLYNSEFNLMMSYIPELSAQVAKFPLDGGSSLYILVPNDFTKTSLALVESKLTRGNVAMNMVKEMNSVTSEVSEVTLPKIKLLQDTNLIDLLDKMHSGTAPLFYDPNLCGMFVDEEPVDLSNARHSAFLSLTEKGVETAAVSSISFSRSINSFSAMQPFILMVWSDQINAPLFMGKVVHPK